MAAPLLKAAEPLRVEGEHVILGFDPEFAEHLKRVDTPRTRMALEKAMGHELRRTVGVKFVLEDRPQVEAEAPRPAAPAPAPAAAPAAKKAAGGRKHLASDPAVQKTIEEFGADIIDIRE